MQPEVKTTDTATSYEFYFDLKTRPLWWWEKYKFEEKSKGNGKFIGDLSGCYKRFKTAIERFIPVETRIEVYKECKTWWLGYCERWPMDSATLEYCLMDLKNNPALNAKYENGVMKLFFAHLKENGLEAKDYLNMI